jgi:hypothetical protein
LQLSDRDRFNAICRTIWGDEWHRPAAAHLGKARRTILYWSKEDGFEPQGGWTDVFVSLLSAVNDALQDTIIKKQRLIEFKRSYSGAGR